MKTLININKLTDKLKELGYESFCDENCVLVSVDHLVPLLVHKYCRNIGSDIFGYSLDGDRLICENIGGFSITIPLV